jgi:hypothetical protein
MKSRDSSVCIALDYGLDDRGSRVRFPAGAGNFSLHHSVQKGSGAHPASYPTKTRGFFPGSKAAGAWSWPLTSIKCRGQRMRGGIPPLRQYAFMAWCPVRKAQGQLYLTFTFTSTKWNQKFCDELTSPFLRMFLFGCRGQELFCTWRVTVSERGLPISVSSSLFYIMLYKGVLNALYSLSHLGRKSVTDKLGVIHSLLYF